MRTTSTGALSDADSFRSLGIARRKERLSTTGRWSPTVQEVAGDAGAPPATTVVSAAQRWAHVLGTADAGQVHPHRPPAFVSGPQQRDFSDCAQQLSCSLCAQQAL